jgi:hypothetical protein
MAVGERDGNAEAAAGPDEGDGTTDGLDSTGSGTGVGTTGALALVGVGGTRVAGGRFRGVAVTRAGTVGGGSATGVRS